LFASQGSLLRATAATGMNKRSSRSHAIFTITLEQRRCLPAPSGGGGAGGLSGDEGDGGDSGDDEAAIEDYLCAKMHLVDLAGACCPQAASAPCICSCKQTCDPR